MSRDHEQRRIERQLVRRALMHHRKHEEQLERLLADALAASRPKCRCGACRLLRQAKTELEA